MSFSNAAGHEGSANSPVMIAFSSATGSYGLCIQIRAFIAAARTYTHSQAVVVRTPSMSPASILAMDSLPPADIDTVLREPAGKNNFVMYQICQVV
jgi:hypothetical protein